MSEIKKAAFYSYLYILLSNIGGLLVTPYIIRSLGDSEYGLYALIGSFVGYLSVLDLGLSNTIVRFVAQYRTENDKKAEENFIAVTLIIYIFISILLLIAGIFFYHSLESFFGETMSFDQLEKAKQMTIILILNLFVTLPGGCFTGICTGYKKFVFPRLLSVFKYVFRALLVVFIMYLGSDSIGLVILDTVLNFSFIIITMYYVLFKLKVTIKLHFLNKIFVKSIFKYSSVIFLFAMIFQLQWRASQVLLGINYETTVVGIYSVGVLLATYYISVGKIINNLILPKAVQSVYSNFTSVELTKQLVKIGRVSLLILLFLFGGFYILGEEFIQLWAGENYKDAWLVAILIMGINLIPLSQGYASAILEAQKKLNFKAIVLLSFCILGLTLGYFLSKVYGISGMVYGLASSMFIANFIIILYYHFNIKLDMIYFLKKAINPFLLPFLIIMFFGVYLNNRINDSSWLLFFVKSILYVIFYLGLFYKSFNDNEKNLIFKLIKIK